MKSTRQTSRRAALGLLLSAAAAPALAAAPGAGARGPLLKVYKTPTCGCCGAWVERMRSAGFTRVEIVQLEDLSPVRARLGVSDDYASCHTAVIGGYALEGHVPPADVARLLKQKPAAVGLAVPGMPIGSPGMEQGGRKQPFDTLLVLKGGGAKVFARHGA